MTLDNLNIFLISKSFEKECTLTEPYYGTKYCKEKLNITEEDINSYKCEHNLDYPPENNFIPTNFELLPPPEKIGKYPEKIRDHKNLEVWHLQDIIFKKPRVYAIVCQRPQVPQATMVSGGECRRSQIRQRRERLPENP